MIYSFLNKMVKCEVSKLFLSFNNKSSIVLLHTDLLLLLIVVVI